MCVHIYKMWGVDSWVSKYNLVRLAHSAHLHMWPGSKLSSPGFNNKQLYLPAEPSQWPWFNFLIIYKSFKIFLFLSGLVSAGFCQFYPSHPIFLSYSCFLHSLMSLCFFGVGSNIFIFLSILAIWAFSLLKFHLFQILWIL